MTADCKPVLDCANYHGEAILWNPADDRVWWSDIMGKKLWWSAPASLENGSIDMPDRLCAFAPRANGGWLMAFAGRVELWTTDFEFEAAVCTFEAGNSETRLNDGRTDRQGGFVVGGMNEVSGAADSSVIYIAPDLSVRTILTDVACANSTCFDADGRSMIFTDTPTRQIVSYRYEGGQLGMRKVLYNVPHGDGLPDSSCVDAEGGVWNALWEGGAVIRIGPDGRVTHRIDVPVDRPTCCAFGGADLGTLFITTSRLGALAEELERTPLAGALFAARPGFQGLPDTPFAG